MRHVRPLSLFLACFMVFSLFGCAKKAETAVLTWEQQYELGLRYMSEGNYKEAIIAFTSAIEIDPKRVETYRALADVYVEMGDAENARATLESGYAATADESLQKYLDYLDSPEALAKMVTPFESRKDYQDVSTLTAEQTAYMNNMIAALKAGDRGAMETLGQDFPALFERTTESGYTYNTLLTKTDEYKVSFNVHNGGDPSTDRWLVLCIRPENGTGYYASVRPAGWLDLDAELELNETWFYSIWEYAVVDCVNWNAEGSFQYTDMNYQLLDDGLGEFTDIGTGTAAAGVILSTFSTSVNALPGIEVYEYTDESTYENGHLVLSDGSLSGNIKSPFNNGVNLEWIFW